MTRYHLQIGLTNWHVDQKDKLHINGAWEDITITRDSGNMQLNAVYYCATNQNKWAKGYSPTEAKINAGLTTKAKEKQCQFYVMAAIFDNPTPDELKNLYACITADQISGSPTYYKDGRTDEDTAMINAKHVGWMTVEKNY
jgi:hypothetical protein